MKDLIDQISASFDRLSAREQMMVLVIVAGILTLVLMLGGYVISNDLDKREKRISAKARKLEEVASLRGVYRKRLAEQERLASEVRRNSGTRLLSYLEKISERTDVPLSNVSERGGEATGSDMVREDAAVVEVRNVSIDRLDAFLRAIDSGNRLVMVRRLKIKPRYDNQKMLDAVLTVGTFKPTS